MKNNQSGIGHLGLITSALVLVVLGASGWFVYKNQKNSINKPTGYSTTKSESNPVEQPTFDKPTNREEADNSSLPSDWVDVASVEDVINMPPFVPKSFKDYMMVEIKKATSGADNTYCDEGRKTSFSFYNFSSVNIRGTYGPTSSGSGPCGGKTVWVLNAKGSWDMVPYMSFPCTSENGGKIYEEYLEECTNIDGEMIKNPNGSIKSLAQ